MTEEKREDLRKFVAEQQGETVAPSEEEALAERAVTALVPISETLDKLLRTQKDILRMIQRIG